MYTKVVSVISSQDGSNNQDITFTPNGSDPSWTPKIAIVQWNRANTSADTFQEHCSYGKGFTDGTNQRCVAIASEDNQARGDTAAIQRNNALICALNPTGTVTGVDCVATFSSWLTNGMRINWSDTPAAQFYITVMFLGGNDITNTTVGTLMSGTSESVNISVTGLTYTPETAYFLMACAVATENSGVVHARLMEGAAKSSSAQWVQATYQEDNPVTMLTYQTSVYGARCVFVMTQLATTNLACSFSSFNSDGFTLYVNQNSGTSLPIYYLIFKGGQTSVGHATEPASTQAQTITTNTDVKAVLITGNDFTEGQAGDGCVWTSGMADSALNQACDVFEDTDNVADSIVVSRHDTNQIYLNITANATASSTTLDDESAITGMSGTGFTNNWTNIGQARAYRYITFGGANLIDVTKSVTAKFDIIQNVTKSVTAKYDIYQNVSKSVITKYDIYQEIVKQATVKFDVYQEVTKTFTTIFDILVTLIDVIKTFTVKYDVYEDVQKQATVKFDIYQEVSKSVTTKFDIIQEVMKQVTILSDIYQEIVKTITTKYDIHQEVLKTATIKFDILKEVVKKFKAVFDIIPTKANYIPLTGSDQGFYYIGYASYLVNVIKTITAKFDILEEVTKDATVKFDVYQDIEKDATIKFDIMQEITKAVTIQFDIIQEVVKQFTVLHNIYEEVSKSVTAKYDIYQDVSKSVTVKFDILQEILKQFTVIFDILEQGLVDVTKTFTTIFNINQEVSKSVITKFDILQDILKTVTIKYDIYQEVSKSVITKFDILQEITKSATVKFDIIQEVTKQFTVIFDILELGLVNVTKTFTTIFDVIQEVQKSATTKFDIYQEIEKDTTIKFDIYEEVSKSVAIKFDIIQEVIKTNTMLFDILQQVEVSKTVKFDIYQTIEKDFTTIFDILQEIEKQFTVIFNIESEIPVFDVEKIFTTKFNIYEDVEKSVTTKFDIIQDIVKRFRIKFNIKGKHHIDSDHAVMDNSQKDQFNKSDYSWNVADHRSKIKWSKRKGWFVSKP